MNTYYMPGTIPGLGHIVLSKTKMSPRRNLWKGQMINEPIHIIKPDNFEQHT